MGKFDHDLFGARVADACEPYDGPGFKGASETSREAAEAISESVPRLRRMAIDAIAGGDGLTAEELAAVVGVPREAIQPRTSELRALGVIIDSGQRRRNASGKSAIVWVLAPGGAL